MTPNRLEDTPVQLFNRLIQTFDELTGYAYDTADLLCILAVARSRWPILARELEAAAEAIEPQCWPSLPNLKPVPALKPL